MIEVRQIEHNGAEYYAMTHLRREVLRRPLGLDFTSEDLTVESGHFLLAAFDGLEMVGCLVLTPYDAEHVKMRQVAVVPGRQGKGIGKQMVDFSERFAREKGFGHMILHARDTAVPFYLALGYEIIGEPFEEVTIPHRKMAKKLL